jgi:hypothetical protein
MFHYDNREQIEPDLDPRPRIKKWPTSRSQLSTLGQRLDPDETRRLPGRWKKKVRGWRNREHVLMLRVSHGFFLSMGVGDWKRFGEVMDLLAKDPQFVGEAMMIQGRFAAGLVQRVLRDVEIDAALFVEPIAENRGPLISPEMYETLVLPSYEPALEVLDHHGVETKIFVSFANPRLLIPSVLKCGFNCLWAFECNMKEMDYRELRREFGRSLRLIGGIDLDTLRRDKKAIRQEIEAIVPSLLADGGYIPMVDGRIRQDVPLENYVYYRRLLAEVIRGSWGKEPSLRPLF